MGRLIFVLGGARSGKSSFAMRLALERSGQSGLPVTYIATAQAYDEEMRQRIAKHRDDRPPSVRTIEEPLDVARAVESASGSVSLVDCLTLLMTNIMYSVPDFDSTNPEKRIEAETETRKAIERIVAVSALHEGDMIIVSNDVGVGIVPPFSDGRLFQDIAGRAHQAIAQAADEVYYMVAGIPAKIK